MNTHIEKKDFLGLAISLALSVLYCGAFWRQTSFTSMILCCLILLFGFFTLKKEPKNILQRDEKLFALSLLLFFVSALLSFLVGHGYELKSIRNPSMPSLLDIDLPSKYLLGALIFVLFLKLKFVLQKRIVFYSIALGGVICGIFAGYERYVLGCGRVDGLSGIAEFADESSILALLSMIIFTFFANTREKPLFALSIFASSFAMLATGTRGASLGIVLSLIAFLFLVWFYQKKFFKSSLIASLFCVLAFVFIFIFTGGIKDSLRVQSAVSDIEYYDQGNIETSLGARFEMWKEAVAMFQMAPFFGLSTYEISQNLREIRERSGSQIPRDAKDRDARNEAVGNKHSQILNAAAKRGVVGVLALLFVWFAYFKLFYRYLKAKQSHIFAFALSALMIGFYYLFPNSFTGDVWESNVSVPLIILSVCLFYKLILQERECAI